MAKLENEIIGLFNDPSSIKVLSAVDEDGTPHTVFKGSLTALEDGLIAYAEVLESSQTNQNMVRSIWFDKKVSIAIRKDGTSYHIKGKPVKCLTLGPLFKRFLQRAKERRGPDADIQSIWLIAPEEVKNESTAVRIKEEEERRPFLNKHLDLIRKADGES